MKVLKELILKVPDQAGFIGVFVDAKILLYKAWSPMTLSMSEKLAGECWSLLHLSRRCPAVGIIFLTAQFRPNPRL